MWTIQKHDALGELSVGLEELVLPKIFWQNARSERMCWRCVSNLIGTSLFGKACDFPTRPSSKAPFFDGVYWRWRPREGTVKCPGKRSSQATPKERKKIEDWRWVWKAAFKEQRKRSLRPQNLPPSMMKLLVATLYMFKSCGRLAVPLEQAFLAESPDASEEAQARSWVLLGAVGCQILDLQ